MWWIDMRQQTEKRITIEWASEQNFSWLKSTFPHMCSECWKSITDSYNCFANFKCHSSLLVHILVNFCLLYGIRNPLQRERPLPWSLHWGFSPIHRRRFFLILLRMRDNFISKIMSTFLLIKNKLYYMQYSFSTLLLPITLCIYIICSFYLKTSLVNSCLACRVHETKRRVGAMHQPQWARWVDVRCHAKSLLYKWEGRCSNVALTYRSVQFLQ